MIEVLKAKITGYVTNAKMDYGSITIGKDLLDKTGIIPNQMVWVHGNCHEKRIRTYVLEGKQGEICLNGNASVLFEQGDLVHILATEFINLFENTKTDPKKVKCQLQNNRNVLI